MNKEISEAIHQYRQTDYGSDSYFDALENAIRIADIHGEESIAYDLRENLIEAGFFYSRSLLTIMAFSWNLKYLERHNKPIPYWGLLWNYKGIITRLSDFNHLSIGMINSFIDDFKAKLFDGGFGLHSFYSRTLMHYLKVADIEKAKEQYRNMLSVKKDQMSDCPGCVLDTELWYNLETDNYKAAVKIANRLFSSKTLHCNRVPLITYPRMVLAAYFEGEADIAASYFEKGIKTLTKESSYLAEAGKYILYLAFTDTDAGRGMFRKYHKWSLLPAQTPLELFYFYVAAAVLFAKTSKKIVTMKLDINFPFYNKSGRYDVTVLSEYYKKETQRLASEFDKRNGNNYYNNKIDYYFSRI